MYTIYIRSIILTSSFKRVVLYTAWTRYKPDMSYLWIFGLLGWVHIPKQVQKGKLKFRAVKFCLLG